MLTKMFEEYLSYLQALLSAQQIGFVESDFPLGVEGYDKAHKWNL
jgi:homoserine dehydrogenase